MVPVVIGKEEGQVVIDFATGSVRSVPLGQEVDEGRELVVAELPANLTDRGRLDVIEYLNSAEAQYMLGTILADEHYDAELDLVALSTDFGFDTFCDLEADLRLILDDAERAEDPEDFFSPDKNYLLDELASIRPDRDSLVAFAEKQVHLAQLGGVVIPLHPTVLLFSEWIRERAEVSERSRKPVVDIYGEEWFMTPEESRDYCLSIFWENIQ